MTAALGLQLVYAKHEPSRTFLFDDVRMWEGSEDMSILLCYTFEFVSSRGVSDLLFRIYMSSLLCRFAGHYVLTQIDGSRKCITNHLGRS